ncbi:MAG TPA: flavin reductase [Saprospiraceae bacterium]|nr:flavin reductase [Saprospiraceae bacterium]HMP25191.1 flavin reductase [Saprospiraceae bacterium]
MTTEKHITTADIAGMERFYRQALFNMLSGFKSAHLIGTISPEGATNLAIFNSVLHIGANPPYMGFILRPTSVERHTYNNLKANRQFTINHVHQDFIQPAHQTSAKYPAEVSEFEVCGFTPQYTNHLRAPYVQESRIKIGLEYVEESLIQVNSTLLIVGKIVEILLPEAILTPDGHLRLDEAGSVAVAGLDTYYAARQVAQLDYARPGQ